VSRAGLGDPVEGDLIDHFVGFGFLVGVMSVGLLLLGAAEKVLILVTRRPPPPRPRVQSVSDAEMAEWNKCLTAVGHHRNERRGV
jgi:hypothetical protein